MKIKFVLENGKRKTLANALGEAMNAEVRYLGAPTFCFEAGGCLLDKDGVLEIPEGVDHGLLLEKLTDAGFRLEQEETAQEGLEQERHIVSVPAHDFDRRIKDNVDKLLAAKGSLIMAALGVGRLQYSENHGYLAFDLYDSQPEQKELVACTHLLNALYNTAREQARVTAKPGKIENPKYAMRCFLLKLGFIGPEYKETRSVLLSRLPGNGSFKSKK